MEIKTLELDTLEKHCSSQDVSLKDNCHEYRNLLFLILIILGVGAYLVSTTVMISKDGVTYIDVAKKIADNPGKTLREIHLSPGYPFLIYLTNTILGALFNQHSNKVWIISAQLCTFASYFCASISLYFIGKHIVGPRDSFWGIVILSILPVAAAYGSDTLSEWPYIMFLSFGFLLILLGSQNLKPSIFFFVGIAAGLGYLVRSEGCQLILYAGAWLLYSLVRPQNKINRAKSITAIILLLIGFLTVALPYMLLAGYVFPKQEMWKLPFVSHSISSALTTGSVLLAYTKLDQTIGNGKLITNICETLLYYFVPALVLGIYYFYTHPKEKHKTFFVSAFIIFNVALLLWQSSARGFLSRRHTLTLVAFTIFYIPIGMHTISYWLHRMVSKSKTLDLIDVNRCFMILMTIGFCICIGKFIRTTPLGWKQQGYVCASEWLTKNTTTTDIIAVPDLRIAFYAERQGLLYSKSVPQGAQYVVRVLGKGDENIPILAQAAVEQYTTPLLKNKQNVKLQISKITPQELTH